MPTDISLQLEQVLLEAANSKSKMARMAITLNGSQHFLVKAGSDWVAVGMNFTSYELINSTVLLSASYDENLEFDVIGQSEMSIPPLSPSTTWW